MYVHVHAGLELVRNQNEPQGTPSLPKKPTFLLKCATPAGTSAALAERWQLWTRCEICGQQFFLAVHFQPVMLLRENVVLVVYILYPGNKSWKSLISEENCNY